MDEVFGIITTQLHLLGQNLSGLLHDIELNPGPVQPSESHKPKCLYLNSRSIYNNIRDLEAIETTNKHDLIAITETWLKPSINDGELFQGNLFQIHIIAEIEMGVFEEAV